MQTSPQPRRNKISFWKNIADAAWLPARRPPAGISVLGPVLPTSAATIAPSGGRASRTAVPNGSIWLSPRPFAASAPWGVLRQRWLRCWL